MPHATRTKVYEDDAGWAQITREAPHLVVTKVRGVARVPMVETYLREVVEICAEAKVRVDVFHDWSEVKSIEPDARALFLKRSEERREANARVFRGMHVAVTSRLVYVALEVASVLYRRTLHVYRNMLEWEAALATARSSAVREPVGAPGRDRSP